MGTWKKYGRVKGTTVCAVVSQPGSGISAGDTFVIVRTRKSKYAHHVTVQFSDGHYGEFPRNMFEPID